MSWNGGMIQDRTLWRHFFHLADPT